MNLQDGLVERELKEIDLMLLASAPSQRFTHQPDIFSKATDIKRTDSCSVPADIIKPVIKRLF